VTRDDRVVLLVLVVLFAVALVGIPLAIHFGGLCYGTDPVCPTGGP
jgi:hypothetical protein